MTGEEFHKWLSRSSDLIPDVANFLGKANDRQEVVDTWAATLKPVSLADANRIVDEMLAGQIEEPRSMSRLPGVVRRESYRRRPSTGTGPKATTFRCHGCERSFREARKCHWCGCDQFSQEYSCLLCLDQGVVVIWSLKAMEEMQASTKADREADVKPYHRTTVRCICDGALQLKRSNQQKPPPQFDPACMCLHHEDLREFVYERLYGSSERMGEFDAFNGGPQQLLSPPSSMTRVTTEGVR